MKMLEKAADTVVRGETWPPDDASLRTAEPAQFAGSLPVCVHRVRQDGDTSRAFQRHLGRPNHHEVRSGSGVR